MSEDKESKKEQTVSVPEGLEKCPVCGEYKGRVKCKDLNWEGSGFREKNEKDETPIGISCRCEGVWCPDCGRFLMRRPVSNYYDPEKNRSVHVPYFMGTAYGECICKRQAAARARKEQQAKEGIQDKPAKPTRLPTTMVPPGMHASACAAPTWYLVTGHGNLQTLLDEQSVPQEERGSYEKALDHFWEASRCSPLTSQQREKMVKDFLAGPDNHSCDLALVDSVAELALVLLEQSHRIFSPDSWG